MTTDVITPDTRRVPRRRPEPKICSCGEEFAGTEEISQHLLECPEDYEIALPLNTVVMYGMRRFRVERGLTLQDIADKLGVDRSAISRMEAGKRRVVGHGRNVHAVTAALGLVTSRDLLRACDQCGYHPDPGYRCLRCGMASPGMWT
jgi:hypothetical protein